MMVQRKTGYAMQRKNARDEQLRELGNAGQPELRKTPEGLALVADDMLLRADFAHMIPRIKPGALQRELLVRAARVKGSDGDLTAVDATAGLGEDALLLAAAGFAVTLFERDPIIGALLEDALQRASSEPQLAEAVSRMHLRKADSVTGLHHLESPPDVILLDPMFPEKRKSAAAKKKLQLIQLIEQPCEDEEALLEAAIAAKPRKIVIKRPVKGPYLAGMKPHYSLAGKAIRYDCLAFAPE